nr:hypothetical protein [Micromonospora sp. DSM 115978]
MDSPIPRSNADGFWDPDAVDPVDTVAEQLMTGGTSTLSADLWDRTGCHQETGPLARDRAAYHPAVLAALAARYLLGPEVVTASVIGPRRAAHLHIMTIARYVPCVSHVSVFLTDGPAAPATAAAGRADGGTGQVTPVFDQQVVDELELSGIVLNRAASPAESAFGANLVVVIGPVGCPAGPGEGPGAPVRLAKGALLLNASGRDLPPALADQASQVFVDDLSLVETAAANGLARPARARLNPQQRYQVIGDLRQVVLGEPTGRIKQEQVLLVELLTAVPAPR